MKKFFILLFAAIMTSALSSCGNAVAANKTVEASKSKKVAATSSTARTNGFLPTKVTPSGQQFTKDKHGMPTYPPSVRKRYVRMTAYSHMENEPGAPGRKNAAGGILKYGKNIRSAAADWSRYPLGTKFKVKGLPYTYIVDDYGSALVGTNTIDMYFPTLSKMRKFGTRKAEITVIQWGSTERTIALLKGRTRYKHCAKMYYGIRKHAHRFHTAKRG